MSWLIWFYCRILECDFWILSCQGQCQWTCSDHLHRKVLCSCIPSSEVFLTVGALNARVLVTHFFGEWLDAQTYSVVVRHFPELHISDFSCPSSSCTSLGEGHMKNNWVSCPSLEIRDWGCKFQRLSHSLFSLPFGESSHWHIRMAFILITLATPSVFLELCTWNLGQRPYIYFFFVISCYLKSVVGFYNFWFY